jgi:hypothetical protein
MPLHERPIAKNPPKASVNRLFMTLSSLIYGGFCLRLLQF